MFKREPRISSYWALKVIIRSLYVSDIMRSLWIVSKKKECDIGFKKNCQLKCELSTALNFGRMRITKEVIPIT